MKEHKNTYTHEQEKDEYLNYIKHICNLFMENKDNINHIPNKRLLECHKFIVDEYERICELKDSMKVQNFFRPFEEIYSNLDSMIMNYTLLSPLEKITFIEFTKEVNYLQDILTFCYGILGMILNTRKI